MNINNIDIKNYKRLNRLLQTIKKFIKKYSEHALNYLEDKTIETFKIMHNYNIGKLYKILKENHFVKNINDIKFFLNYFNAMFNKLPSDIFISEYNKYKPNIPYDLDSFILESHKNFYNYAIRYPDNIINKIIYSMSNTYINNFLNMLNSFNDTDYEAFCMNLDEFDMYITS